MLLKDKEIVIRNATENDVAQLCAWWADGKVMAHAGFPNGVQTDPDWLRKKIAQCADEIEQRLILEIGGVRVGEMSYSLAEEPAVFMDSAATGREGRKPTHTAEIGIKICDFSYQNRGYGTRALRLLLRALFDQVGAEKIKLDTNLNNVRAQHVYENLGFCQTRVVPNAFTDQLGVPQTALEYELIRENFIE